MSLKKETTPLRKCPVCRVRDLFLDELVCCDCAEPEDHDD